MQSWKQSKIQVGRLPTDHKYILDEYLKNEPDKVDIKSHGKYTRCQVELPKINDFEIILLIYVSKDKEAKKASYVIFNEKDGVAYERDLLNEHFKEDHTSRKDWLS